MKEGTFSVLFTALPQAPRTEIGTKVFIFVKYWVVIKATIFSTVPQGEVYCYPCVTEDKFEAHKSFPIPHSIYKEEPT